jgi:hypothetical protein
VTTCPHCFNTLKNEYPDFGVKLEVVHHTDFLLGLLAEGSSCRRTKWPGQGRLPRQLLPRPLQRRLRVAARDPEAHPRRRARRAEYWTKQRGLCCGAGGAQMFMEEQNKNRVNVKRTLQLVDTGATTVASACPFCMTMLTDGIKSAEPRGEDPAARRGAELLEQAATTSSDASSSSSEEPKHDTGLGLEWVWLNADVGILVRGSGFSQSAQSRHRNDLELRSRVRARRGVRLLGLTVGLRARDLPLSVGNVVELDGEIGFHSTGNFQVFFGARGGYLFSGNLSANAVGSAVGSGGTPPNVTFHGGNLGFMLGFDYYFNHFISLGLDANPEFMFIERPPVSLPGIPALPTGVRHVRRRSRWFRPRFACRTRTPSIHAIRSRPTRSTRNRARASESGSWVPCSSECILGTAECSSFCAGCFRRCFRRRSLQRSSLTSRGGRPQRASRPHGRDVRARRSGRRPSLFT